MSMRAYIIRKEFRGYKILQVVGALRELPQFNGIDANVVGEKVAAVYPQLTGPHGSVRLTEDEIMAVLNPPPAEDPATKAVLKDLKGMVSNDKHEQTMDKFYEGQDQKAAKKAARKARKEKKAAAAAAPTKADPNPRAGKRRGNKATEAVLEPQEPEDEDVADLLGDE